MFTAFAYNVQTGEWSRQELPGPPTFEAWWKSWVVYRTALLLLQEVNPEPLDLYGEFIRTLRETLGDSAWFLIYQGDQRMRSEEFERIRRRCASEKQGLPEADRGRHPFDSTRPWNLVFTRAVF